MMIAILYIIFNLGFLLLILFLTLSFLTGAPFVPTSKGSSEAMLRLSGLHTGMTVVDLGSGDGRLLFMAARQKIHAIGYEINPYLVFYTKLLSLFNPDRKYIRVFWKNLWSADVSKADAVFVYLIPWRMEKLQKKLSKSCKPGTIIVSNSFIFPSWEIYRQDQKNHIYAYKIK